MRVPLNFLRLRPSKPIPKKGSPEYIELQKRLIERKKSKLESLPELPLETTPAIFKYTLFLSLVPSTAGILTMALSDHTSTTYSSALALTGTWIGLNAVLISAYNVGLEAFLYQSPYYSHPSNFFFTGGRRVIFSALGIPMGVLCLHSTITGSWIGIFSYFSWLMVNTLTTIRCNDRRLMPGWLGTAHWPWLVHTKLVALFLIYSMLNTKCREAKEDE